VSEIIQKIIANTGLSEEDINKKILDKQHELSNLVSREGAAYIVAKELGLDLIGQVKVMEIKDITSGAKNLSISATVFRIFPVREFEKDGKKIKVANLFLSDSSGIIRMSLWDEQTELLKGLKEGNVVEISGAYSKNDWHGGVELRLEKMGRIKVIGEVKIGSERISISAIKEGKNYEVRAALLHLFESSPFYEICPQCGSRVKEKKCAKHGAVEPKYAMVVSGVMDDGSANMRIVFFREQAEKILGMSTEQAKQKKNLFDGLQCLGKEFIFFGRVRKNLMFERNEFVVQSFKEIDVKEECNKLLNSFAMK